MRSDVDREVFVERLTERWLVERCMVTIYELSLERLEGERPLQGLCDRLAHFLEQERLHQALLEQLLTELGRDVRSQASSPALNLGAAEMSSLIELLRDRHLEPRYVLDALMVAERIDGGGWELLTELGRIVDLEEEWLRGFRAASREEAEHAHVIGEAVLRVGREALLRAAAPPA